MATEKKINHSKMKLGKRPPRLDDRTFQLSSYLNDEERPPMPHEWRWAEKIEPTKWGLMRNKRAENCTCAAAGHFIMAWTSSTGKMKRPRDKAVMQTYIALTGYDPVTDANDDGAYSIDVLKYWRKNDIDGHKILAFAAMDPKNHRQIKEAIYLFGGCFAGLALPLSAQKQAVWDVPPGGATGRGELASWGGHAVLIIGYSKEGLLCVTWGKEKMLTWDFWDAYCEEAFAAFSEDFIKDEKTPTGINIHTLTRDLDILKQKKARQAS
ncbi:MAG: hypothetical protein JO301_08280 [Chitinophagaceae bacterium]|nr:hypothetical protein [Chitinophagaceae bacterium]